MNTKIANILKGQIAGLDFVDKIAGLVHVAEERQGLNDQETIVKRYPISCDYTNGTECVDGVSRYADLIPDDKKKSVIYFEDGGTSEVGRRGRFYIYRSRLRLVGWLNIQKLGLATCTSSEQAVLELIKTFPRNSFNAAPFTRMKIRIGAQQPKRKEIFARYTYNDFAQYLVYPFDYFALDVDVTFHFDPFCVDDFVIGVEDPCEVK